MSDKSLIVNKSMILKPFQIFISAVKSIKIWFILLLGLYGSTYFFEIPLDAKPFVRVIMVIAVFLQIGITANVLLKRTIEQYVAYKAAKDASWQSARGLISFILQTVLWALILLLILDNLGIDTTALVTGLGVGGIAAALAINNILGDLFASLSIVLDDPFEVGDFVIVGDLMGTVEHIGIKSTRIRSLSGEQIVFSNSDLLGSRIRNYKRMKERRVVFAVGIIYETPKDKLQEVTSWIRSIIESVENTRFDRCHFKSFGAYSLDFETVYYVLEPDYNVYMDIQQKINLAIFEKFEAEGIEFAYPTQMEFHKVIENAS